MAGCFAELATTMANEEEEEKEEDGVAGIVLALEESLDVEKKTRCLFVSKLRFQAVGVKDCRIRTRVAKARKRNKSLEAVS